MSEKLKYLIAEITKYGFTQNYTNKKYLVELEIHLTQLLLFHQQNEFLTDDKDYPQFQREDFSFVNSNLKSNFSYLKDYKYFQKPFDVSNFQDIKIGNIIDDINEIILQLLEVKLRLERSGELAGLYLFDFIFDLQMKEKILNLLNYLFSIKKYKDSF